ncbi:hypothetical protein [Pseudomonas laurentiana]
MSTQIAIPTFQEWFLRKHGTTFEARYRHPHVKQDWYLAAHIDMSREYMHEQLQVIAHAKPDA